MATERNLWQPLAILAIVAAIVLAVLLNRMGPGDSAASAPDPAPSVPSAPQPNPKNPEPKLSNQISVLLKDADPKVRARALALLAAWKPPAEIKAQVGEMLTKDSDVDVKFAALSAIGEQKIVEAFGAVLEAAKAEDVAVRRKAVSVLGQMGASLTAEQREGASAGVVAAAAGLQASTHRCNVPESYC